jgi:flagellar hook assembly protein FlgD
MVFSNLPAGVDVKIFTQSGELVRSLITDAGGQTAWDGTNSDGNKVVSGVYLAILEQGSNRHLVSIAVER